MTTSEINRAISLMFMIASEHPQTPEAWAFVKGEIESIPNSKVRDHISSILSVQSWAI